MSPSDFLSQCPGLSGLNAYMRPLSVTDVKSCVEVENTFPEQERCSEEKFIYRLTVCPTLSMGLFIKTPTGGRQIGHVIGARISSNTITEASMGMPENWQSLPVSEPVVVDGQTVGNDPSGGNVAIHSVVTIPEFQGKGIGRDMVKAYVEYIREEARDVKSIVLIAHDYLIRFYEQGGFKNRGTSECRFAGGVWTDLVCDI
ncbi:acyl-CoA N-acyltransferase [Penicillium daleae]|uniref:Acyl-CoA N-acyltransferase n=1 Tax=Penicillium daleae TaxID=63821 RepID=A0AAD6G357_9EURO|nr:acyl-CoA N-acyltransferase [Penicillium daleae]KAJ5454076.1 acyl-CoA N-acyltransferase [Penicillium daleae]